MHIIVYYALVGYNRVVFEKKLLICSVYRELYFLHFLGYIKSTFIKNFSIQQSCISTFGVQVHLSCVLIQLSYVSIYLICNLIQISCVLQNKYLFINI